MAARGKLAKSLKLLGQNLFKFLLSHSPRYGDVQVICFKIFLKFKMTATDQLHNFCGRKKSEIIHILQSHSPRYGDVQVILQGLTEIQAGR